MFVNSPDPTICRVNITASLFARVFPAFITASFLVLQRKQNPQQRDSRVIRQLVSLFADVDAAKASQFGEVCFESRTSNVARGRCTGRDEGIDKQVVLSGFSFMHDNLSDIWGTKVEVDE